MYIISNVRLLYVHSSASGIDEISFASETDENIKDESDSSTTYSSVSGNSASANSGSELFHYIFELLRRRLICPM